jgi:predicted DNA-binding transcriptional regulator AlpA
MGSQIPDPLLPLREVMRLTAYVPGGPLTEKRIRMLGDNGELPCERDIGGAQRWRFSVVMAWVQGIERAAREKAKADRKRRDAREAKEQGK